MTNTRDSVYDYGYFDDNGIERIVSLTTSVAEAGGFVAVADSAAEYLPLFCRMRHIGVYEPTSKQRHQIPIAILADSKFQDGGTVAFGGETCNIVGKTGERFRF